MSSLEGTLRSVCDFHPSKEVGRVIFWLSDSPATPLSPAVQLRLVTELSRHYSTEYPTVTRFVVATPSIGSREDVWACGLFKLLVETEEVLPHASVVMSVRGSRSVTHADVYHLKRFLRDHHLLDLWTCHDAHIPQGVKASHSPPTPQQRHAVQTTTAADHYATKAPDAGKDVGPACPPGKKRSRQRGNVEDGSAAQPIHQFPPPPSLSRFHATPLAPHVNGKNAKRTSSPRQPALQAVREPARTNSRGKKKEHPFRNETHHRSKAKHTSAARAMALEQSDKHKPSESRIRPLPVVDKAVAWTANHHHTGRRTRGCAFCSHPHCVA
ncbi:hypothetical protein AAVH_22750, partial [Aphelenchoides avenae]